MPCWKHEERQARLRFLCQVPSNLKLLTFPSTTALQRKLSMRRVVARLYTGYRLLTLSFHFFGLKWFKLSAAEVVQLMSAFQGGQNT